ncbi:hypothetical protein F4818DRAFT_439801 [Hypoxylon cercidicola]|nr:hypothetical protein F4818DRAFT_439801 [Hypoxylon cercidicola]
MEIIRDYNIEPATEADIPTLTEFLVASKRHLAINRFLFTDWPAEGVQRANYGAAVRGGMNKPDLSSLKAVHNESRRTVAYLVVARSAGAGAGSAGRGESQAQPPKRKGRAPEGIDPAVLERVEDAIAELGKPDGDYLVYMYVEPPSRGMGIGELLLRECVDRAQWEGLPLSINCEPNHHDWFRRRGFRDVRVADIDLRAFAAENSGYGVFRISRMTWVGTGPFVAVG